MKRDVSLLRRSELALSHGYIADAQYWMTVYLNSGFWF